MSGLIIDNLPSLPTNPTTGDELPIERGTTAYKTPYADLADAIIGKIGGDPVTVAHGGTGATTASGARTNLGLGNVDNTSDADKPVSTAQQAALDAKESTVIANLLHDEIPDTIQSITFDSTTQNMLCPYCGTQFDVQTLASYDTELKSDTGDDMQWQTAGTQWHPAETAGLISYICNSCGGEIVGDSNTAATACPFCDNPVLIPSRFSGDLRPDLVIPFRVDKEQAKAALRNHYKGKLLLPRVFKDENHIDEIKGIYVPFWLFDANAKASIRYKATRHRTWSDAHYIYTVIKGSRHHNCEPIYKDIWKRRILNF